ncbi:MAG: hypothetical protein JW741_12850 [Sedimentisphaerales bacterium]|nr:hypothetical protein [Sedimentisphaerales bacterium]
MSSAEREELARRYLDALEHCYVAYRYFASSVPSQAQFANGREVVVGEFHFRKSANAMSMDVELGWAFFTRLEAILEAFISRLGIRLRRDYGLLDYLVERGVDIPDDFAEGLRCYREIRNTLHHGDGDASLLRRQPQFLSLEPGCEPHLMPQHVHRFHQLFTWLGHELPLITD